MSRGKGANIGRILETGSVLGALTLILAATGLLLSPTFMVSVSGEVIAPPATDVLFVIHMTSAILLVAFLAWHLVPFAYALLKKAGQTLVQRASSFTLLALILVEIATGYVLYAHDYRVIGKEPAVLTHLATTFLLLIPLTIHALRGVSVWRERRAARETAFLKAQEKGRASEAMAQQASVSRRAFLRMAAYAVAGVALAFAIGSAATAELRSWRLNSVGRTPNLTKEGYRLRVTGLVNNPIELSFEDLRQMNDATKIITHHCVEGWDYTDSFTGVPLSAIIRRAGGVKEGGKMLIFKSPETSTQWFAIGKQYTTNFPYSQAAVDQALVVYAVGGKDLPREHGFPVRLMNPGKWGYKACKWLTEIEVSSDASYQGYWEDAGYHNNGDYPGPIFA